MKKTFIKSLLTLTAISASAVVIAACSSKTWIGDFQVRWEPNQLYKEWNGEPLTKAEVSAFIEPKFIVTKNGRELEGVERNSAFTYTPGDLTFTAPDNDGIVTFSLNYGLAGELRSLEGTFKVVHRQAP